MSKYIAKNIRAGLKINQAREILKNHMTDDAEIYISVTSFDHGRDVCGNGTAHYTCELFVKKSDGSCYYPAKIVESGYRREQVGYSGANEAALNALRNLGYDLDLSKRSSYDYRGTAFYPLINF